MQNRVLFKSSCGHPDSCFQSGVSLHGHTRHSFESLGFIGKFLDERSLLRSWIDSQRERGRRNTGIGLDLDRAYWTPPLCERQAFALEYRQIQNLGLRPLVSLSDHDTIDACTLLRQLPESQDTPISTEWTVPFGRAIFHLGIHNLPEGVASSVMPALREASKAGLEPAILDLLLQLSDIPEVLLVLNHPLWNLNAIHPAIFAGELSRFLRAASGSIHAVELNGMRSYRENRDVVKLAAAWDHVLISGGDRHGCEPNAALNLTDATDFPQFVDEIRRDKQSTVLLMPQYQEPLCCRMYKSFTHVIDHYPAHPDGRRSWDERIFHPDLNGEMAPLIDLWYLGPPGFLKKIFKMALWGATFPIPRVLSAWSEEESPALARHTDASADLQTTELLTPVSGLPDFPSVRVREPILSGVAPLASSQPLRSSSPRMDLYLSGAVATPTNESAHP